MTHNEILSVLGCALSLVVFMLGYWRGHYRAYAECCDCCTCQTCEPDTEWAETDWLRSHPEEVMPVDSGWTETRSAEPEPLVTEPRRRVIVLEPGPTIYPALAELAGEVMDEPHSHADDTDSTFVSRVLLSWESRYPIPQEVR